jgi:uncharacterized membrane protein YeaQ/YmgE (transglycosylase-associated protein family)
MAHACVGLVVGLIAGMVPPRQHAHGTILIAALAMAGAWIAGLMGEKLGLYPARTAAGFVMSTLGAIALLLAYGLAVYELKL